MSSKEFILNNDSFDKRLVLINAIEFEEMLFLLFEKRKREKSLSRI